jgi:hypothetical protein
MPSGSALLPDFTCQVGPKKESAMADHGESDFCLRLNKQPSGGHVRWLNGQINLLYNPSFSHR